MPTAGKEQNQLVDCWIRRFLQALACPNYAQLEPPAAAFRGEPPLPGQLSRWKTADHTTSDSTRR